MSGTSYVIFNDLLKSHSKQLFLLKYVKEVLKSLCLALSASDFMFLLQINGLSNKYWGWGKEDDEFYVRMKEANLEVNVTEITHIE